ncbi:NAD-dependent epimerase/dehydratase family protein [Xanthomonas rydalmerensis]|uniref:NAD-dependent epimerase/dehydratase family protein n=1 Tax=Xanthomonas rydalmerensis TaxID=3046274 RepID=A0ABZ0JN38_9XANT|nr:NAD-dependent epimerase/dehydratase family protein [Xanthomonas sp. DM-2023]WOS41232.1 NAD-dependent epimerase/dehydratase family protein [Xanthomonas sp. DM-2023]WOS45417.1 NAD-dependent epimerase/dehydratase family protein [Xanthomonas sp. DM-2023]WOS49596.1 NAD-dependent epimerase/dehydratase family protein [Xanthomonas sp. DM-2023]WOS53776.1 NAD-dependent epimerase/dehydratase family protein [Xanthomonas sp. DM-2023]WOS57959.1 NAD-dependent epimerase/dehydratase family protein [Xanthomo
MSPSSSTALVLGASGGIGGELARQLRDAGWQVRALQRGLAHSSEERDGIHWRRGDALQRADVLQAAQGCAVIVHAVNPPGYRRWSELVLPMIDNTLAAAIAERATVVLPGTVYNYGPDAYPAPDEDAPQHPLTRKGAIRVELERRLQAATAQGARAIVVRAGDFFGPRVGNSWFAQGLVRPGQPVATVTLPGDPGVGHQWAYVPDVARTMLALLQQRTRLPAFARMHLDGHWDADGTQMAAAIARVAQSHGLASPRTRRFPWPLLTLALPFWPLARELHEMRPLWRQPLRMRNARLLELLGEEPHTPLDVAVEATLHGLGCLPAATSSA